MFKVNNKDTKTMSLASEQRSDVFIVSFGHILSHVIVFLSVTLNRYLSIEK